MENDGLISKGGLPRGLILIILLRSKKLNSIKLQPTPPLLGTTLYCPQDQKSQKTYK